jgi:hypothetical protein
MWTLIESAVIDIWVTLNHKPDIIFLLEFGYAFKHNDHILEIQLSFG